MLESHMDLKELKVIIEVNKKPKREKFLNQSFFEGKNESIPKFPAHMVWEPQPLTHKSLNMILKKGYLHYFPS